MYMAYTIVAIIVGFTTENAFGNIAKISFYR